MVIADVLWWLYKHASFNTACIFTFDYGSNLWRGECLNSRPILFSLCAESAQDDW